MFADHTRARQCLLNLIGNAIKFSSGGEVTIKVRTESRDGSDLVVFDVADTGIGIKQSDLDNLFRPFGQANASIGKTFGGTGLGLSISRDLARAMGGDITVVSVFGEGSTFSLSIPVATAEALRAA
jgi:signal transduction histidine kinase